MMVCDQGCTRIVILVGRWAIKLPRFNYGWQNFLRGLLGNMQEKIFSATGWPELCPVVFALPGGFLVVMRRARALSAAEWEAFDFNAFADPREWDKVWVVPGKYPESNYVPTENKSDSFGMLDGRLVAVDYGS